MKNLVIILTFLISLLGSLSASEAETSCADFTVKPEVEISTSYGQLSYDFNHNTQQISALAAEYGQRESSFFASGLATITINNEYVVGVRAYPLDDEDAYCVVPAQVKVFVGFASPRIYVSKDMSKNSCEYNLILLHERTHQRINIATLNYFLPLFKESAAKIAREIQPVKITAIEDLDKTTNKITKIFSQKFTKVLDVFKKELAIEQGKLDNSINYSMENNLCRNFNAKKRRSSLK